jgi:NAD(P)-dependent dehydrogenase (short-subunit alcohol dehydrogenase family)
MKDVKDQTILVTGSTDGLGKETCRALAAMGATVLLHGRDQTKLHRIAHEIKRDTGNEHIRTYLADLSSLEEVRRLAADVIKTNDRLDALISNAGVGFGDPVANRREVSRDGHELRFAVNYLAPYVLTNLLVPLLRKSAPSRIVNVASIGQEPIDFSDVMLTRGYGGMRAYRQSKTALIMFTFDLAERLKDDGVTVNCLHPATLMDTAMVRDASIRPHSSVRTGVESLLYVATSPDLDGVTGQYFDQKKVDRAIGQAYDEGARDKLLRLSEELTGVKLPSKNAQVQG